jgi:hypothetical protein
MENDNLIDISNCIICMEYNLNEIIFDCNHTICLLCYERMLSINTIVRCPICRNIVDEDIIKPEIIVQQPSTLCRSILTSTWFALLIFFVLLGGLTFFFINPMKRN